MSEQESQASKQVNVDIAGISDVSGQANVAGGHIIHADKGATVIIGTPAEAVSGLIALRELMQRSSDVRNAVTAFRADFRVIYEQVDRLGDYKDLHDLLHHLQFHCYNGIVQAVARFSNDELMLDNLEDHALTLEEIVEELRYVSTRLTMSKHELAWIDEVGIAKAELRNAIDLSDEKLLRKVIWRLNRVLATQPTRINALLNYSAHALHLPKLLNALASVASTLTVLDLDTNQVSAFQSGVRALSALNGTLITLVDDHDQWQTLDVELRRIEASIDHDLIEFEMSWPDIKLEAAPLYLTNSEEWAIALKKESDALDDVLTANNPSKLRRGFRSYQRRVTDRFYRVDIKLKALCGDMRQIGTPLAAVLEMIYDHSSADSA